MPNIKSIVYVLAEIMSIRMINYQMFIFQKASQDLARIAQYCGGIGVVGEGVGVSGFLAASLHHSRSLVMVIHWTFENEKQVPVGFSR